MPEPQATGDAPEGPRAATADAETLIEIRAIVRIELLDAVVRRLKTAGVPRLTVERVHAIGSGVDPDAAKISFEEGSEYADMARVRFICPSERHDMYAELIANAARTGRNGDGIVSVHPVLDVMKIRTGASGSTALS